MSRELSDWISGYLTYTANSEPPLSYHTWAAISVVAGALQRKVWLEWGYEMIHPNMYIVLVGPSGKARKGVAINLAKKLMSECAGISMTSESTTREALILAMKRGINNFQEPDTGVIRFHCSITAFSEELSVFLGQNDIKFLANLTDWYDSKDTWTYETKGTGRDHLQGLCFNLLGATAPDWLQSMLPQEAVGGGFTSRVVFVVEERKGKTVSKHTLTDEERGLQRALVADLERVASMAGPFSFDTAGEKAYTSWYEEQDALLEKGEMPISDPRFSGYCERRATHMRKLMMVLSASRSDERVMSQQDFDRAIKILSATELKMHKTFGGLGQAKYSDSTERIINYIKTMGLVPRSNLLAKFYRDVDGPTLKIIEEVMYQMHVVKIEILPEKGEKLYRWIGET